MSLRGMLTVLGRSAAWEECCVLERNSVDTQTPAVLNSDYNKGCYSGCFGERRSLGDRLRLMSTVDQQPCDRSALADHYIWLVSVCLQEKCKTLDTETNIRIIFIFQQACPARRVIDVVDAFHKYLSESNLRLDSVSEPELVQGRDHERSTCSSGQGSYAEYSGGATGTMEVNSPTHPACRPTLSKVLSQPIIDYNSMNSKPVTSVLHPWHRRIWCTAYPTKLAAFSRKTKLHQLENYFNQHLEENYNYRPYSPKNNHKPPINSSKSIHLISLSPLDQSIIHILKSKGFSLKGQDPSDSMLPPQEPSNNLAWKIVSISIKYLFHVVAPNTHKLKHTSTPAYPQTEKLESSSNEGLWMEKNQTMTHLRTMLKIKNKVGTHSGMSSSHTMVSSQEESKNYLWFGLEGTQSLGAQVSYSFCDQINVQKFISFFFFFFEIQFSDGIRIQSAQQDSGNIQILTGN
ncbi:putative signal peptide protein [Puccinia sorghi]|uniref:Putative signal peptide protein n=1 Tax=Puccinia sorghi TaxID=27349 RepID=A0A0L6VTL2_9BASI|nr:putative signal peptide protein [Puccinia sorghi]